MPHGAADLEAATARPLELLMVEDSADDAELILLELKRGGFRPRHLRVDTAEAMAAALADRRWELVLSDYQVPGFGGMAALRALQATELDIPFILVSGAIGEDVAVAAVKAGAHGYVLKDNLVRLCSAVERELKDALARREQRQAKADLLRSEEQRRQMEATLRDLDRLSTRGQMAAYIAHEINNPLAGIKNAFDLLEPAIPLGHPHRHYADLIKREIDRIAGIIRTMYHVYRPSGHDPGEVALAEVFQDIQSLLEPKCRAAGVVIRVALADPELRVHFSGGTLRQVIFNLVMNAVEASPRGGRVLVDAGTVEGRTEIRVADQGMGIAPELGEQIYQQGFSTKLGSGMSGLGLGLGTCRSLVESMGGALSYRSGGAGVAAGAGPGCTFLVQLPCAPVPDLPGGVAHG